MVFMHFLKKSSSTQFMLSWWFPEPVEDKETELVNRAPLHSVKSSRNTEVASCLFIVPLHETVVAVIKVLLLVQRRAKKQYCIQTFVKAYAGKG